MSTPSDISAELVDRTDGLVNRLGSDFLFHEQTLAHASRAGIDDALVLYAGGRAGVMGDVNASQVIAAFGFFESSLVHQGWSAVEACSAPSALARIYAEAIAHAGRHCITDDDDAAVVAQVGWTVAEGVEALGLSLFAGWRRMRPVAEDDRGSAALAIMTLRELRGDIHVQSVAASGISALEAELGTRGPDGARAHGWPEPYPDIAPIMADLRRANEETSRRMQRFYGLVDSNEVRAFMTAVDRIADRVLSS